MTNEKIEKALTHKQLVKKAKTFLEGSCSVVVTELYTAQQEYPDALGFNTLGDSALVECKISRSDFFADKKKHFRINTERGMGNKRYFMAPKGLLTPEDVGRWGLIEVWKQGRYLFATKIKESDEFIANKTAEVGFLTSIMRRLQLSTAVFVREAPLQESIGEVLNDE